MKLSRLSILAVATLTCAAFAISCESNDPRNAIAPFWTDGDVDGSGLNGDGSLNGDGFGDGGLNGGDAGLRGGDGFGNGGLNGGDGFDSNGGPGAYGEDLNKSPYIDGFGAKIEGVEFQPLYFPYDANTISSSEENKVAAVAQYLLGHSEAGVVIEGYCDERGTEEYNRALGERRALAASEMLIDIYGIESARIKTVSYGEERPAVTGTGDAVWSKNRRDEFVPVYLKNN
ncbi:MAG: OmpA family protein [Lentisphaeria bacterium]|nr:OmpA family protein [Lentisphaeria bacterium]